MQLQIQETTADSVRAGYECPCGCRPSVTYERAEAVAHEGCCCGNEFAVGPGAATSIEPRPGYRAESTSFAAPWGETINASWLIGPSVHSDEAHGHDHGAAAADSHGHAHDSHRDGHESATQLDPVCGMTVDVQTAEAKGLHSTHKNRHFYFCGRGCKLEFDDDPERYLDPSYAPSM